MTYNVDYPITFPFAQANARSKHNPSKKKPVPPPPSRTDQEIREQEVSQIVDAQLKFEAVFREFSLRRLLDGGVVDEGVEAKLVGVKVGGERPDGRERRQIQMLVHHFSAPSERRMGWKMSSKTTRHGRRQGRRHGICTRGIYIGMYTWDCT